MANMRQTTCWLAFTACPLPSQERFGCRAAEFLVDFDVVKPAASKGIPVVKAQKMAGILMSASENHGERKNDDPTLDGGDPSPPIGVSPAFPLHVRMSEPAVTGTQECRLPTAGMPRRAVRLLDRARLGSSENVKHPPRSLSFSLPGVLLRHGDLNRSEPGAR